MEFNQWYCQPDGGQWNVRCAIVQQLTIDDCTFAIIASRPGKEELMTQTQSNNYNLMLVSREWVYPTPQGI